MRLNIKYKLFLAILSAHFLVYLSIYSSGYYNFNQGFLDYISRIEERQVPALVDGLVKYYKENNSWDPLRSDTSKWIGLLRESIESSSDPTLLAARQNLNLRPKPNSFSPNDWYYTSEYSPARPYLHLLDADQSIIFGNPEAFSAAATLNPIIVEGVTVGYLAVTSRQQLSEQADLLFAEQQKNNFLALAIVLVFLSALIAFPAATFLTRPVREVVAGTRALTSGDYTSRIKVRGSDELGQLAEDFNTLALTLEQNRSARQQWIADISHELRTPLAILQGELEAMQDGIRPLNTDTLDSLHNEVIHLNTLVNDLHELSMSDLGALVYEKEQINIAEVLEQSVDMHRPLAAKHKIRMSLRIESNHPDKEILMLGDEDRLMQLFDNLLQNTCRYTDPGGELQIVVKENTDQVRIEWFDTAPGVKEVDLQHLFDRLYRVEASRNRAKGGSGLGLTICQNIVHAHEGTITASPSPLGGLKLTIIFPRRPNTIV
jgi:two-component system sensor histidine kinase BaeS